MVRGEEIYIHPEINVGLAVAMEEGLIVQPFRRQIGLVWAGSPGCDRTWSSGPGPGN